MRRSEESSRCQRRPWPNLKYSTRTTTSTAHPIGLPRPALAAPEALPLLALCANWKLQTANSACLGHELHHHATATISAWNPNNARTHAPHCTSDPLCLSTLRRTAHPSLTEIRCVANSRLLWPRTLTRHRATHYCWGGTRAPPLQPLTLMLMLACLHPPIFFACHLHYYCETEQRVRPKALCECKRV